MPRCPPLHCAAAAGYLKKVKSLLDEGHDIDETCGRDDYNYGSTALLIAVEEKQQRVAKYLIQEGADIHFSGGSGNYSVLHYCARNGWLDMVKILINESVDINVLSDKRETPLYIAARKGRKAVAELLLNAGADIDTPYCSESLLHIVASWGWAKCLQLLLRKGVDLHDRNSSGKSAMHLAVSYGHLDVIEVLLHTGADINYGSKFRWTILVEASRNGNLEVVRFLLERGADTEIKSRNDFTALFWAAKCKHKEVAHLLIDKGADIFCTGGSEKKTLLHYCAENGWHVMAKYLLTKGLDIDAKSIKGNTALQIALIYRKIEVIELLISKGANVNVGSDECKSPLSYTISKFVWPNVTLAKSLIRSGAYVLPDVYPSIKREMTEPVLQDIELCSQAIINKFNHYELPKFYNMYQPFKVLPSIKSMHIIDVVSSTQSDAKQVTYEVIQSVKQEIEAKGFCNLSEARPIVLKMLAVKSFNDYCDTIKTQRCNSNPLKRSAGCDLGGPLLKLLKK